MLLNEKRAKDFLEKYDLDALISSSRENTTYLTDFLAVWHIHDKMASGPSTSPGSGNNYVQTYGVYTRGGKRALVLPLARFLFTEPKATSGMEVFTYGTMMSLREPVPHFDTVQEKEFASLQKDASRNFGSPGEALSAAIRTIVGGDTVGLDYSDIHSSSLQTVKEKNSDLKIKNASEMFRFLRMVKSEEEIRRLKRVVEVTEIALDKTVDNASEGKSEMDLWQAFSGSVASNGALFENAFMSPTGTRSGGMAAPSEEKKLTSGDVGWFDFGCSYLGYHSDTGESFSLGQPTERQTKIYNALEEVVDRSIELAAPGMSSSDLCDAVVRIWDKHGVPRPPTGMGHGIGLEPHEYPLIASQGSIFIPKDSRIRDDVVDNSTNFPFEEGMVLNFEAPYMVWGWGGVHLEKTVVVEKNGSRLIAPQERHLRVIN